MRQACVDNRHVEALALRCQAVLEAMRGRAEAARNLLDRCRETLEDLGLSLELVETAHYAGLVEHLTLVRRVEQSHRVKLPGDRAPVLRPSFRVPALAPPYSIRWILPDWSTVWGFIGTGYLSITACEQAQAFCQYAVHAAGGASRVDSAGSNSCRRARFPSGVVAAAGGTATRPGNLHLARIRKVATMQNGPVNAGIPTGASAIATVAHTQVVMTVPKTAYRKPRKFST
jgi:hypothetical protein